MFIENFKKLEKNYYTKTFTKINALIEQIVQNHTGGKLIIVTTVFFFKLKYYTKTL